MSSLWRGKRWSVAVLPTKLSSVKQEQELGNFDQLLETREATVQPKPIQYAKRTSHPLISRISVKKFRPAVALERAMDALLPLYLQGSHDAGRQDHKG